MNATLTESQIVSLIELTIHDVNMDVELKQERTGVNMMYDFIKNEVIVDSKRVQKACNELLEPMPLETYIRVLTIHELGHAMDREALLASLDRTKEIILTKKQAAAEKRPTDLPFMTMVMEEHEADIAFEETAWVNAEILNSFFEIVDGNSFGKVKAHSLSTYRAAYDTDLKIYNGFIRTQEELLSP
ncbi:integrase [Sporosarcina thermotolerans]|uniref:Integrase n=1 Tax=Sporosarcina thermotolerans TaxID=633404 RepID=A0AAW9AFL4_9BACL|nr:integrase [Sporosarcina thermotolerans]MDW0117978.1 integrase [Sporosarcina thermotolerans]WHT49056.1 integrase [Sporosarcina thermotolerans]